MPARHSSATPLFFTDSPIRVLYAWALARGPPVLSLNTRLGAGRFDTVHDDNAGIIPPSLGAVGVPGANLRLKFKLRVQRLYDSAMAVDHSLPVGRGRRYRSIEIGVLAALAS